MSDVEFVKACLEGGARELAELEVMICKLSQSDEVRQAVRKRLLVDGGLAKFQGRSSLWRWMKTVSSRIEIDLSRSSRETPVEGDVIEALLPASAHLESKMVREEALTAMKAAMHQALGALSKRDQLFVKHAYLDGLTLTAIGKLYGVAPSTVMRALDKSLAILGGVAREHLGEALNLGGQSLESLVRTGFRTQ